MKKKIVSLMMAAVLSLSLAACSGTGAAEPAQETPAEEAQEEQAEEEEASSETEAPEAEETAQAEEEDSLEMLFSDVASYEEGTAGSGLKAASLAARFIALYTSGQITELQMAEALAAMPDEERDRFTDNFVDVVWPIIEGALDNYDLFSGVFEDLGISQEVEKALQENFTEEDLETLQKFVEALKEEE